MLTEHISSVASSFVVFFEDVVHTNVPRISFFDNIHSDTELVSHMNGCFMTFNIILFLL